MISEVVRSFLVYALLVFGSDAQSTATVKCPPVALSLVLDKSGSIRDSAAKSCFSVFGGSSRCNGAKAMKDFAKGVLDTVRSGPQGSKSQYSAVAFDTKSKILSPMKSDAKTVKRDIDWKYQVWGGTNIKSGIVAGHEELKRARPDLAKVMLLISDGKDNAQFDAASRKKAADDAKQDDITIFAYGFHQSEAASMKEISGDKDGKCRDCHQVVNGGLSELTTYIEKQFCKKITVVIPPTPAPAPKCSKPKDQNKPGSPDQNKDEAWSSCLGNLCKHFPYPNGSSALCIQHANAGACKDPTSPYYRPCSCTCGVCCEPTTEPKPPETPTFPDCATEFKFPLQTEVKWLTAKDSLIEFFENCEYDFDTTWSKLVKQYLVKVERGGNFFAYDGPDGIAKMPYEPLTLHICMPDDFPVKREKEKCRTGLSTSSSRSLSTALAALVCFVKLVMLLTQ
jgi:hypothetical protein